MNQFKCHNPASLALQPERTSNSTYLNIHICMPLHLNWEGSFQATQKSHTRYHVLSIVTQRGIKANQASRKEQYLYFLWPNNCPMPLRTLKEPDAFDPTGSNRSEKMSARPISSIHIFSLWWFENEHTCHRAFRVARRTARRPRILVRELQLCLRISQCPSWRLAQPRICFPPIMTLDYNLESEILHRKNRSFSLHPTDKKKA